MAKDSLRSTTRTRLCLRAGSLLMLIGVVATCSGNDDGDGDGDDGSGDARSEATAETSEESTTSTAAAADGTDVAACADGTCEVEVTPPVDIPLTGQGGGITALRVTEVSGEDVTITVTSDSGGTGSVGLSEGCIAFETSNGGSSQCPGPDPDQPLPTESGTLTIQPVVVSDGTAVIRFAAG